MGSDFTFLRLVYILLTDKALKFFEASIFVLLLLLLLFVSPRICNCFGFGTSADAFWWMRMTAWLVTIPNTIVSGLFILSFQLQSFTSLSVKESCFVYAFTSIAYNLCFLKMIIFSDLCVCKFWDVLSLNFLDRFSDTKI